MHRMKLAILVALAVGTGILVFSISASAGSRGSAGATDRGAIGLDAFRPDPAFLTGDTIPDWGIVGQLKKEAKPALDDAHVIVVATQCSKDDTPSPGTCFDNPVTETGVSESGDEDTTLCPSTWANGQLPDKPGAAKGYVCVYVLGGANFGTAIGGDPIHGVSIAPGSLASTLGFKVAWGPNFAGDSYIDAVWAYKR